MSAVDSPIMPGTTRATHPHSYPQRTKSTRACPLETDRASDAGERFADWDVGTSKPDGFVVQLLSAHAPARIVGRFGKASFSQLGTGDVPHGNKPGTPGNSGRDFVRPIFASVTDFGMQDLDPLLFASLLRYGQLRFVLARQVSPTIDHAIGAGDLLRQAQVNPYFGVSQRLTAVGNLTLQVDVPPATSVLGEASRFEGAFDGTRQPQAKHSATEADGISLHAESLIGKRYPAERTLAAAPGQATFAELPSPDGIFHTYTLDSLGGQPEIM